MNTPEMDDANSDDEFLHQIRVRPQARFANRLKMKLDQASSPEETAMHTYIHSRAPMSRRSVALLAIGALHAAFILAFAGAFGGRIRLAEPPPSMITEVYHEPKERPPETPVSADPTIEKLAMDDPTPPRIEYTDDAPTLTTIDPGLDSKYSGVTTQSPSGSYVRAGIGKRFPNPESFYPPSAIRQELEGKALVHVCVGPNGKLAEAPQIAQSTQNRLLDEAALRLARAGNYLAGSRDGVAITDCFNFQAKFQLDRN